MANKVGDPTIEKVSTDQEPALANIPLHEIDALRESEERQRILLEAMKQAVVIIEKVESSQGEPSDYRYIITNPAFENQTGFHNVIGKRVREVIPDIEQGIMSMYDDVLRKRQPMQFEAYVPFLDKWFEVEAFPISAPGQVAIVYTDITERKKAAEALRESEERQAFLLKLSDSIRHLADPIEIQNFAVRLLGEHLVANQVHYGETIGDSVIIHQGYGNGLPPMIGRFRYMDFGERLVATYRAGKTAVCYNVDTDPTITKDEAMVITGSGFRAYIAVPLVKDGEWVATLAAHSIKPRVWTPDEVKLIEEVAERTWAAVERVRAETALRETERQFRTVIETAKEGITISLPEGGYTYVNQRMADMLGYPMDEMLGKCSTDFSRHEWHQTTIKTRQKLHMGESSYGEYRFQRKDGSDMWVMYNVTPMFNDKGVHTGNFTMHTDITERKKAEEALRESEALLRAVMDGTNDPVFLKDRDGRYLMVNKACCEAVRKHASAFIGKNDIEVYNDLDIAQTLMATDRRIMTTERADMIEECIPSSGGERIYLSNKTPWYDASGNVTGIIGIARDITDRKTMEEELAFHSHVLSSVHDAICALDSDSKVSYWNNMAEEICGWTAEEVIGHTGKELFDLLRLSSDWDDIYTVLHTNGVFTGETSGWHKGGIMRYVDVSVKLINGHHGGPQGTVISFRDITERKRMEEKLKQNTAELQKKINLSQNSLRTSPTNSRPLFL